MLLIAAVIAIVDVVITVIMINNHGNIISGLEQAITEHNEKLNEQKNGNIKRQSYIDVLQKNALEKEFEMATRLKVGASDIFTTHVILYNAHTYAKKIGASCDVRNAEKESNRSYDESQ